MRAKLLKLQETLRSSLWFVPGLLVLGAIALAFGLISLDRRFEPDALGLSFLAFGGGPDGARGVLSAIATSMVTVAGVTYSITMVTLTLAAQQYTPRVLRSFTADRANQVVLGTFVATFVYCLLVLRTIRADGFGEFVPHYSVTAAVLLALVSLVLLIYFIHHTALSLQPTSIVATVAAGTHAVLDRLFPEPLGEDIDQAVETVSLDGVAATPVCAEQAGYLQSVDVEALLRAADREERVIRMERRIGDFVPGGALLATVIPELQADEAREQIRGCFITGRERTLREDPEFGVLQISDIALKALSPGINDPRTALTCIDYLGDLLRHLGSRRIPSAQRKGADGQLRVIALATDFERMVDLAFGQIRHYGRSDVEVLHGLLETIAGIGVRVTDIGRRRVLSRHVELIQTTAEQCLVLSPERDRVVDRARELRFQLDTAGAPQHRRVSDQSDLRAA